MSLLPRTVSAKDIQRNYRKIFDEAKRTGEPIVVLTNNQPDIAIIDIKVLDKIMEKIEAAELSNVLEAIKEYKFEKKNDTLIKAASISDLLK